MTPKQSSLINIRYTLAGATLTAPYLPTITVPLWHINNTLVTTLYSDTNDVRYKKGFIQISSGGTSFYECIKYINLQEINNNPSYEVAMNNIIIFRLADIELLKAEALCAMPAPDYNGALSIVNSIRSNRNAAPVNQSDNILQTVIDERGRELFLEGHRFYDLVRLERLNHIQQFDEINPGEFTNGKYYWPIDPGLFLTNSKLTQTPFWTGRVN